ncbi:MAG: tetratricopeptide repeat protein, partial [Bacteroidota bacterium]
GYLYGFNGMNDQSYRPLVLVNLAIETALFGQKASVHHFFNVLLYALSCFFLMAFARRLLGKEGLYWAFGACLLFTAHPIHTEVVANIKSRDEILSFLFVILSLDQLIRFTEGKENKNLFYSLGFFVAAVWSKESTLAMVGIVPFALWLKGIKDFKTHGQTLGAFLLTSLVLIGIRALVMDSIVFEEDMDVINNSLMAASNYGEEFATNTSVMGRYLGLMFFPHPLSYDYSYNQIPIIGLAAPGFLVSFVAYLGLMAAAVWLMFRQQAIGFGIVWFGMMLALVSNFLTKVGTPMAERFLYASSFGFCLAFAGLIWWLVQRFPKKQQLQYFLGVLGVITLLYSVKTVDRNMDWENGFTLYASGLISAPNSARVHNHYASQYRTELEAKPNAPERAQWAQEAIEHYSKAIEIYPQYSEAGYNLGVTYYTMGDIPRAQQAYETVLTNHPNHINSLNNLGVIAFNANDYNKALSYWSTILQTDPNNADALGNVGAVYHNNGNYTEALKYYDQAIQINPRNVQILNNVIKVCNQLGDTQRAAYYQGLLNNLR